MFEVFDATNTHILTTVPKHAFCPESVKDRTYNRSARSYEIGQLLLRKAKVLPEAMLAARRETS